MFQCSRTISTLPFTRHCDIVNIHTVFSCITDVGQWMSANQLKLNTDKTELLCAGPRHGQSSLTGCGPSLQLRADTVTPQDDVRLLGVTISSDLSLQRHLSNVSAISFCWLQLKFHWDQFPRNFPVANVTGKSPTSYEEVGRVASLLQGSYEEADDFQTISTCQDGLATSPTSS